VALHELRWVVDAGFAEECDCGTSMSMPLKNTGASWSVNSAGAEGEFRIVASRERLVSLPKHQVSCITVEKQMHMPERDILFGNGSPQA
jgi:hypothetical protein